MNTATLHKSSWGRVFLLTREGFFSSLRPLLIFHLIMAVALFGFPFMILILSTGFDIVEAFSRLASSYNEGGVVAPYLFGTTIFSLVWLNTLQESIRSSQPPQGRSLSRWPCSSSVTTSSL